MQRSPNTDKELLAKAQQLLDQNKAKEAVEMIRRVGISSPATANAYGVALMRAGETAKAIEAFRNLCVNEGGVCLKAELPALYKVNFATALLLGRNVSGGIALLGEIRDEGHPAVMALRSAIARWKRTLSLWERLALQWYGAQPAQPVTLDAPPGALFEPDRARPAA